MNEKMGYAVLSRHGNILAVSTYQRNCVIRQYVDPAYKLSPAERREAWKEERKKNGVRVVRAKVAIVEELRWRWNVDSRSYSCIEFSDGSARYVLCDLEGEGDCVGLGGPAKPAGRGGPWKRGPLPAWARDSQTEASPHA
jgi:hypothetical protein